MKKNIIISNTLILFFSLVLVGCSSSSSTTKTKKMSEITKPAQNNITNPTTNLSETFIPLQNNPQSTIFNGCKTSFNAIKDNDNNNLWNDKTDNDYEELINPTSATISYPPEISAFLVTVTGPEAQTVVDLPAINSLGNIQTFYNHAAGAGVNNQFLVFRFHLANKQVGSDFYPQYFYCTFVLKENNNNQSIVQPDNYLTVYTSNIIMQDEKITTTSYPAAPTLPYLNSKNYLHWWYRYKVIRSSSTDANLSDQLNIILTVESTSIKTINSDGKYVPANAYPYLKMYVGKFDVNGDPLLTNSVFSLIYSNYYRLFEK